MGVEIEELRVIFSRIPDIFQFLALGQVREGKAAKVVLIDIPS